MDSAVVSSNARCRDQVCGHDPARDGALNLVDQDRIRQEAEQAAEQAAQRVAYQSFLVYPTTSIEAVVATWTGDVPCSVPALRNERLPKDFKGPRKVPNYTPTYSLGHGLKTMKWPWSYWKSVTLQWPSTSP